MLKRKNWLLLIACMVSWTLSVTSAMAGTLWSLDFENDFVPSAGTQDHLGTNPADPCDTAYPTHITYADGSNAAMVGDAAGSPANLYYAGVGAGVLGASGTVTMDFKVTRTDMSGSITLFHSDYSQRGAYYWWIGLYGQNKLLVRSHDNTGTSQQFQAVADLAEPLSVGWHTLKFSWEQTIEGTTAPEQRELANIRYYIDDELVLSEDDFTWTRAISTGIAVGSFRSINDATWFRAGEQGIIIDNVALVVEDPPAWDETFWQATFESSNPNDVTSGIAEIGGVVTISGGAVQVGDGSVANHYLSYTGVEAAPERALVSIDFTTSGTVGQACLYQYSYNADTTNYWWMGTLDSDTIILRAKANTISDANEVTITADLGTLFAAGVHNMTLMYDRVTAQQGSSVREHADLKMWVDGKIVINQADSPWVLPGGSIVNIGSFHNNVSASGWTGFESGDSGMLINDVLVSVPQGPGVVVWDVDFEDSFYASSGAVRVIGGDPNDPYEREGNTVYLYSDSTYGGVARVGYGFTENAALNYTAPSPSFLGPNGTVTVDFQLPGDTSAPSGTTCFFQSDLRSAGDNTWYFGLNSRSQVIVRSHSGTDDSGSKLQTYLADIEGELAEGWHTMRFSWERTVAIDGPEGIRERANIQLYIDDLLVLDMPDAYWTAPNNSKINIGSFWNGTASYYMTGSRYVLLDNVKVYQKVLQCGDSGTTYLPGDINLDCYVDSTDMAEFGADWLNCSDPLGNGCQRPVLPLQNLNYNAEPDSTVILDGNLAEWADAQWIRIDLPFYEYAPDVTSAMYACKWDPSNNLVYVAVKVVDTDHNFVSFYDKWYNQDCIELYCQGDNAGGTFTSAYDAAQVYALGADGMGSSWQSWSVGEAIIEQPDPGFMSVVSVAGDEICYEIMLIPYDNYAGREGSSGSTTISLLEEGKVIGLDIIVSSKSTDGFGMLSTNTLPSKYNDADSFADMTCAPLAAAVNCGDWGHYGGDINTDCDVDLIDFSDLANGWLDCTDPANAGCN